MPKKNRIAIYELLFKEGVMVAKKDVHLAKHPELADRNVPNLHVMKAMLVRKWTRLKIIQYRLLILWIHSVESGWLKYGQCWVMPILDDDEEVDDALSVLMYL